MKRNIITCILLSIFTCGIYGIYWYYSMAEDLKKYDDSMPSGGMAILITLLTCGIYGWYWMYKAGVTIDDQNVKYGKSAGSKGIICLALTIFGLGIVAYAIIQDDINKICDLASAESTTISAD